MTREEKVYDAIEKLRKLYEPKTEKKGYESHAHMMAAVKAEQENLRAVYLEIGLVALNCLASIADSLEALTKHPSLKPYK